MRRALAPMASHWTRGRGGPRLADLGVLEPVQRWPDRQDGASLAQGGSVVNTCDAQPGLAGGTAQARLARAPNWLP